MVLILQGLEVLYNQSMEVIDCIPTAGCSETESVMADLPLIHVGD